ncbi:MAG: hypothetical protein AAF572_21580 [Cyanobacteria bacterium P01_B01_bin.77]
MASTNASPENTQAQNSWHIVKQTDGHCEIVNQTELTQFSNQPKTWGPFSRADAIAKRVGLIRAGRCLPK